MPHTLRISDRDLNLLIQSMAVLRKATRAGIAEIEKMQNKASDGGVHPALTKDLTTLASYRDFLSDTNVLYKKLIKLARQAGKRDRKRRSKEVRRRPGG